MHLWKKSTNCGSIYKGAVNFKKRINIIFHNRFQIRKQANKGLSVEVYGNALFDK